MQIVKEYATLAAEDAPRYGLPAEEFYLLFCEDEVTGKRATRISREKEFYEMLITSPDSAREGLMISHHFALERQGWPDEWSQNGGDSLVESKAETLPGHPAKGAFGQAL